SQITRPRRSSSSGIGRATSRDRVTRFDSIGIALFTRSLTRRHEHDSAQSRISRRRLGRSASPPRASRSRGADRVRVTRETVRARRARGGVAVLVNKAALGRDAHLMMLSDEAWEEVLATNLTGPFLCVRRALRPMIAQRWGRIVNVISPAGLVGKTGAANYAA